MKTIEITLTDEVFGVLSVMPKKRDRFVLDAIKEKMEREKKRSLLAEGYKATFAEELALTEEFEAADFESV